MRGDESGKCRSSGHRTTFAALLCLAATLGSTPGIAKGVSASAEPGQIEQIVRDAMETQNVRAAIVKVTRGDQVIIRKAYGPSMTEVPATPEMRFRNGAVAFAYVGNLLLQFVDEKKVTLDDTINKWMPNLPSANKVTLRMLANQTSGYPDFETDPKFLAAFNTDAFHIFKFQERLDIAFSRKPQFAPGANWSYAHTNFMILGEILAKIGGKPLDVLLREKVLVPMGLKSTTATQTSEIPGPVLHTFSAERLSPNYEDATYWNTQWGTPMGANQTTTIDDLITTAVAVGSGKLLSKSSYQEMTDPKLIGFGQRLPGCQPSCFPQTIYYNYGLGIVRRGDWIVQNPLLSGTGVVEGYLPSEKVAIALAVTLKPGAFDPQGNYKNPADAMFQQITVVVAPDHAAPVPPR